jgi:hypothetical protein
LARAKKPDLASAGFSAASETATFGFVCFGFFGSRLLRFWPLLMFRSWVDVLSDMIWQTGRQMWQGPGRPNQYLTLPAYMSLCYGENTPGSPPS